ncbi:hypothetical protein QVD17_19816 [Tagetes erecta]|uniref:Uncharacterized protein n=1 Tax=Tagetes erecta TaxID=13708 RepID=A0AAD8NXM6_TARER|nr:hypothetical protein QVD17_19816 [Tagetes erecta]
MNKSDPVELETQEVDESKELSQFEEVFQSDEATQSEEVAPMEQSEQPKVDSSSFNSDKPLNYVPLPDEVREELCSAECLEQIEQYRTYSFKICDKLNKEEKKHKKLKEDHIVLDYKILSLPSSWSKTLSEFESIKIQLE